MWMLQCLAESFDKQELKLEDWARRKENYTPMSNFLKGVSPPKLLVYRQSSDAIPGSEDYLEPGDDMGLYLHFGETSKIRSKGAYIYRTVAEGQAVNTQAANDTEVMFGEIGANPICSLDTIISSVFVPFVNAMDEADWGECDKGQRVELVSGLSKFASELGEAIKSMSGGVKLKSPDKEFELEFGSEKMREAGEDEAIVNHYEKLMESWISDISGYIEENSKTRVENTDSGPHTELEYWRARNQRLTSINEQTKTKDVNVAKAVLASSNKPTGEHQNRSKDITTLVNNWKNVDIKITEALN